MDAGKALVSLVTADVVCSVLLSDGASSVNIFPMIKPQTSGVPCACYNVVSVEPNDTKSGASTIDAVLLSVDIYAATYKAANEIAIAIRNAIDRYRGEIGGVSVDGVRFITNRTDFTEGPDMFRIVSEYQFRTHR